MCLISPVISGSCLLLIKTLNDVMKIDGRGGGGSQGNSGNVLISKINIGSLIGEGGGEDRC